MRCAVSERHLEARAQLCVRVFMLPVSPFVHCPRFAARGREDNDKVGFPDLKVAPRVRDEDGTQDLFISVRCRQLTLLVTRRL